MITTRDLNLRQSEVKKNLYEMSSTLKAQPVGGTGALIQRPAQNTPQEKRTPILFTPSPMLSSLPYLSDAVKYRSNEVSIMTNAHLMKQREVAKASIIYDDMQRQELAARNERVIDTLAKNVSLPTSDLLRNYLSGEINKQKNEERKIIENRMRRTDLELNPIRPTEPARTEIRLPTLTRGDMGRPNEPTQADLREVRTTFYQKEPLDEGEGKLNEMADKFRQSRAVKKLQQFALEQRPVKDELEAQIRASNYAASEMARHLKRKANPALEGYQGIRYSSIYDTSPKAMIEKALARYESKPTAKGFKSFINREEEPGQEFKTGRTGKRGGGGGGGGGADVSEVIRQLQKGI